MLRELLIRDFALIREISVQFGPGMNILTGESGAGKSIIIDALALLLGARAQSEQLRSGAQEAMIEGSFDPPSCEAFRDLVADAGLSQEPDQFLLLRRHLLPDGRSKAYINGRLFPLSNLRALGDHLIDIQGQGQSQSLLQPKRQLELLDAYADQTERVERVQQLFSRLQKVERELSDLKRQKGDIAKRREWLEIQRVEIEGAQPRPEEEEEIVQERAVLANAEKLYQWCEVAWGKIGEGSGSALDSITGAMASLKAGRGIDERLASPLESLQSARIYLEEAASFLRAYQGKVEFDASRLEELEVRLSVLAKLKRKYGGSISEILMTLQEIQEELKGLQESAEQENRLSREREEILREMGSLAGEVSQARAKEALSLEKRVQEELRHLGMPQALFQVEISDLEDPLGEIKIGNRRYRPAASGIEEICFLFSSNQGEAVKPLSRIISGGELSRAILALKTTLASLDEIPTLILDEVDSGISGTMGEVIGQKMSSLGRAHQVICITHLPQIAAFGDAHYQVEKRQHGDRTEAQIRRLSDRERIQEIARMLGDKGITQTPLRHAREILDQAQEWKGKRDAPCSTP